jgi:hypothetical protein
MTRSIRQKIEGSSKELPSKNHKERVQRSVLHNLRQILNRDADTFGEL